MDIRIDALHLLRELGTRPYQDAQREEARDEREERAEGVERGHRGREAELLEVRARGEERVQGVGAEGPAVGEEEVAHRCVVRLDYGEVFACERFALVFSDGGSCVAWGGGGGAGAVHGGRVGVVGVCERGGGGCRGGAVARFDAAAASWIDEVQALEAAEARHHSDVVRVRDVAAHHLEVRGYLVLVAEPPCVVEEDGDGVVRRAHAVYYRDFFRYRRVGAVLEAVARVARVQVVERETADGEFDFGRNAAAEKVEEIDGFFTAFAHPWVEVHFEVFELGRVEED